MSLQLLVADFHRKYGFAVRNEPTVAVPEAELRLQLLVEELGEFAQAVRRGDVIKTVDALADLTYVLYGTALTFGIDLDAAFAEVHRSNMTKAVARATEGKPAKASNFREPRSKKLVVPWL